MKKRINRQYVAQSKAAAAENKIKKPVICGTKKHTKYSPGTCLICGKHFQMISVAHANDHGYVSADAMIADNKIKFDGRYA